jgi:hypothetical protein
MILIDDDTIVLAGEFSIIEKEIFEIVFKLYDEIQDQTTKETGDQFLKQFSKTLKKISKYRKEGLSVEEAYYLAIEESKGKQDGEN